MVDSLNISYLKDNYWDELKVICKLTDEEIENYKKLIRDIKEPKPATKNMIENDLLNFDKDQVITSEIIQFLELLLNTKKKEQNQIFLTEYKINYDDDTIAGIKRKLLNSNQVYAKLDDEIVILIKWIKLFEGLVWIQKSRVENLRIIHGGTY